MPRQVTRAARSSLGALAIYALLSLAFFGRPLLETGGRELVGQGYDPEFYVWVLGWWPHAVLNGENPFVTHAMWPTVGVDLAWVTAVPALAFVLAPVTVLAGPAVAYNVVAVAMPALTAWTAFLLCRHLTASWWASLAGGYLFGFSSYMLGHTTAHPALTSVFLVPLLALAMVQYVDGTIGRRALALRAGLVLGIQPYLSTELFATLTVALVTSLVVAFTLLPRARARLRGAVLPLLAAFGLAGVLSAPLLGHALADVRTSSINDPALYPADLLNLVVPTEATLVGGERAATLSRGFLGNVAENGAYLGLPLLAVLGWFAWQRRRDPAGRLLVVLLLLALVAQLGIELRVAGERVLPLPWALPERLPPFNNILPVRFSMYVALAAAVAAALWGAAPQPARWVRAALVGTAVVSLLPAFSSDIWRSAPTRPAFFADDLYRTCFRPDENVFVVDPADTDAALWQAESGYRFRLANGNLGSEVPDDVPYRDDAVAIGDGFVPEGGGRAVVRLARALDSTVIMVDATHVEEWGAVLEETGLEPLETGGVWLYHLGRVPTGCRA